MSLNKVTLIGHVGRDPEVRYFENGDCLARISLATTELFRRKEGERQEHTEWHRITFFGRLAETVERYVRKGDQLYVEGALRHNTYQDKDDLTRYVCDIHASSFRFLNSRQEKSERKQAVDNNTANDEVHFNAPPDDEIPF